MGAVVLTGCSTGPVTVTVPATTAATSAACRSLHEHLPVRVDGLSARSTTPASRSVAAWGNPAVVLRCGVPAPAGLAADSELYAVDGVSWFPQQQPGMYVFTTYGRVVNVEIQVPDRYAPQANALVDLAGPVHRWIPSR
ncbi:MAG: DUF3515 domain-containing protein [Actinomycetes bacterium]